MDAAGRAPVGSAAIFAAEARLPVLTDFPLAARPSPPSASERVGVPGWAPRGANTDHVPSDHSTTSSSSLAAAATTRPAASEGARASTVHAASTVRPLCSPPFARYSVATRASSRTPPRADSAVTTSTPPAPPSRTAHAHSTTVAGDAADLDLDLDLDFVADGGGARGSDAASSRASAPNQRTEPALSTARTPPPSTAPAGTSAERPSGRRVDPPTTAPSRDARGSASVQDTSAGSPEPGGASAAKYRPQTGSYVAGDAKVWPRPTAQLRARVCEG